MKLSWHGHSVVLVETIDKVRIIIDPYINGNPACDLEVENLDVDYIVLTHGHNDHVGDALEISRNTGAPIVAMVELANFFSKLGVKTFPINIGGTLPLSFGSIKFTQAIHSSVYQHQGQSIPMGLAAGIILDDGASRIYHAGDTALFSDMALVKNIDVAFLPIGDNYTMGIEDAVIAASLINAKTVVPIHYNTFSLIKQNPYEFINRLDDGNGYVPEIGEVFEA